MKGNSTSEEPNYNDPPPIVIGSLTKILISILLAVLMLGALAAPALAKPIKSYMMRESAEEPMGASGGFTLRVTHDNHVKVAIVLKAAALIQVPKQSRILCSEIS